MILSNYSIEEKEKIVEILTEIVKEKIIVNGGKGDNIIKELSLIREDIEKEKRMDKERKEKEEANKKKEEVYKQFEELKRKIDENLSSSFNSSYSKPVEIHFPSDLIYQLPQKSVNSLYSFLYCLIYSRFFTLYPSSKRKLEKEEETKHSYDKSPSDIFSRLSSLIPFDYPLSFVMKEGKMDERFLEIYLDVITMKEKKRNEECFIPVCVSSLQSLFSSLPWDENYAETKARDILLPFIFVLTDYVLKDSSFFNLIFSSNFIVTILDTLCTSSLYSV